MAKITVYTAAQKWGISRSSIYNKIKSGDISRDSDNKIDTVDMIRIFGSTVSKKAELDKSLDGVAHDQNTLIDSLKSQIAQLTIQLEQSNQREKWLQQQVEQLQPKRIEHKRGLFGRLFGD